MAIKIHPGIGVGRVGDSPDEYFVGPETPFATTAPAGGFRDGECRIKRQAALFRIYEHDADGTVHEITASATTTITWTVRLKKTVFDDPEVSLTGPGPVPVTATSTVYAEMTTDASGRLLLIPVQATIDTSGASIDSRCEGYVHASVVRDGMLLAGIEPSWVVIYPPDFAPGVHPDAGGAAGTLLPLWPGAPATSPALSYTDQLDRGPLTFVGHWDASSGYGTLTAAVFAEPFRFLAAGPGSSLHNAYSSWASDLWGIGMSPGCTYPSWLAGVAVDDPTTPPSVEWGRNPRLRGFLAQQADSSLKYVDWCPRITAPSEVNFYQVPQGSERAIPIRFELTNFPEATSVSASVIGQPNARVEPPEPTPIAPENGSVPYTVWAFFRADPTTPLGPATGTIEFHFDARHTVSIPLRALVVAPTRVAVALVLDCSTSMDLPRGDSLSRLEGLKEAVNVYVDIARPGSALAVAPFSTAALPALHPQILGSGDAADEGTGGARKAVRDFVAGRSTVDLTSIGAGLQSGQAELDRPAVAAFEAKALIVVTDGWQTASPYISDVASSITDRMFAIGVGSVFDDALREIVGASGGYATITGPVTGSTRFDLEKYLLQAVAAIAGDTLSDPEGELAPGAAHRIPFTVSDADLRLDVIVISDRAPQLYIGVQGPTGAVLSLEELRATGRCRVTRTARVGHVELNVPFDTGTGIWQPGAWNLVVANVESSPNQGSPTHGAFPESPKGREPAHYLAMVTTSSALRLTPSIRRFADQVVFEAALSYGGAPVLKHPALFVELATPWGAMVTLPLVAAAPGLFRGRLETTSLGRYRATFRARGNTFAGFPFQRERVIEEVFASGDQLRPAQDDLCACLSRLLRCTRPSRGFGGKLSHWLETLCRQHRG